MTKLLDNKTVIVPMIIRYLWQHEHKCSHNICNWLDKIDPKGDLSFTKEADGQ